MIRVPGDTLPFEDDKRSNVDREPPLDASIELRVGNGIETSVGKIQQADVRDAQDSAGAKQFPPAALCQSLVGADRAGFAMGEAQDTNLTPLARQIREQSPEPKRLVVGVGDKCCHGTPRNGQHRHQRHSWHDIQATGCQSDALAAM
jgi:hypothetical protein